MADGFVHARTLVLLLQCCAPCRLVVMSATLGGGLAEDLQALMTTANQQEASQPAVGSSSGSNGDGSTSSSTSSTLVPVVKSEGRSYPVKTHYLGKPCEWCSGCKGRWGGVGCREQQKRWQHTFPNSSFELLTVTQTHAFLTQRPQHTPSKRKLCIAVLQRRGELEAATVDAVRKALSASSSTSAAADGGGGGDVLVFLPGVAEIKRTQRLLQQEGFIRSAGVLVQQLHGSMAPQQQDEVIR